MLSTHIIIALTKNGTIQTFTLSYSSQPLDVHEEVDISLTPDERKCGPPANASASSPLANLFFRAEQLI